MLEHSYANLGEDSVIKKIAANDLKIEDHLSSWNTLSEDLKDFLKRCLEQDDAKRETASQLLDHPFLTNCGPTREVGRLLRMARQK